MKNLLIAPDGHRLPKLDVIRAIAITLMIVDHVLLIFLPDNSGTSILRATLTRSAEPLFIFVLATLTISRNQRMKLGRWFQIAMVSAITSAILSHELGYAMADILVSIALVSPFIPALIRLPRIWLYVSASLAIIPISFHRVAMDYSPALLIHQVLLTKVAFERDGRMLGPLCLSALVALMTGGVLVHWGVGISLVLLVIVIGHPLAALVVWTIATVNTESERAAIRWTRHSLAIYAVHLVILSSARSAFG